MDLVTHPTYFSRPPVAETIGRYPGNWFELIAVMFSDSSRGIILYRGKKFAGLIFQLDKLDV